MTKFKYTMYMMKDRLNKFTCMSLNLYCVYLISSSSNKQKRRADSISTCQHSVDTMRHHKPIYCLWLLKPFIVVVVVVFVVVVVVPFELPFQWFDQRKVFRLNSRILSNEPTNWQIQSVPRRLFFLRRFCVPAILNSYCRCYYFYLIFVVFFLLVTKQLVHELYRIKIHF